MDTSFTTVKPLILTYNVSLAQDPFPNGTSYELVTPSTKQAQAMVIRLTQIMNQHGPLKSNSFNKIA